MIRPRFADLRDEIGSAYSDVGNLLAHAILAASALRDDGPGGADAAFDVARSLVQVVASVRAVEMSVASLEREAPHQHQELSSLTPGRVIEGRLLRATTYLVAAAEAIEEADGDGAREALVHALIDVHRAMRIAQDLGVSSLGELAQATVDAAEVGP